MSENNLKGNIEIARFLIDNGASISQVDEEGKNAYYYAKESNNPRLIELFHIEKPLDKLESDINAMKLLLK